MPLDKNFPNENQKIKSHVDLQLYHYGMQECQSGHSWGPGIKDHYKIHILFEGEGTYRLGSKTYSLKAGQLFLTTPDQIVFYKSSSETPWTYGWFAFDGLNAKSYLQRATLSTDSPIFTLTDQALAQAKQLMIEMVDSDLNRQGNDLTLLSLLYRLLALMIDEAPVLKPESMPTQKELYLKGALSYIEMNYSRKMTCEEMADRIGVHRKYLGRLFKEAIHTTPQNYLITYRMEKAKLLLKDSTLSISQIGYSVGYDDPLVFSKTFKKYVGIAPSLFQKQEKPL